MGSLTSEQRRNIVLFASSPSVARPKFKHVTSANGSDVLEVRGMPVFRTGTFRDSMGLQHTWERLHVQQMIANFNALSSSGVFSDVPVRAGHTSFFGDSLATVIGYHVGLSTKELKNPVSGSNELYLLADYDILDDTAAQKIEKGLWRHRSAEIGTFLTNNETEYWPTYQGFGYCDIPAVEGLNAFAKSMGAGEHFSFLTETALQEDLVPTPTSDTPVVKPENPPTSGSGVTPPAVQQPHTFTIAGQTTSDFGKVQAHISSLEEKNTVLEKSITALEQFKKESIDTSRAEFVTSLAASNKLPATMIDDMTEFAKGLSDEQYAAWKKPYETASPLPILSPQGSEGQHSNGANGGPKDGDADRIEILQGIVANHKRGNMPIAKLEKQPSYVELQALLTKSVNK
jgi:hypothetical protein